MTSDHLEAQAAEYAWERDKEYGHHARADSQGDTGIQSLVCGDGTKAQLEIPEDGYGYNKNNLCVDDLEAHHNRPQDDPHAILIVPKDWLHQQVYFHWLHIIHCLHFTFSCLFLCLFIDLYILELLKESDFKADIENR